MVSKVTEILDTVLDITKLVELLRETKKGVCKGEEGCDDVWVVSDREMKW